MADDPEQADRERGATPASAMIRPGTNDTASCAADRHAGLLEREDSGRAL